jgi:hypothetical protein
MNAGESNSTDLAERDSLNFRDRIVLVLCSLINS